MQDQDDASGDGLLYFAEDVGGGGGGTWSVEMKEVGDAGGGNPPAAAAQPSLPAPSNAPTAEEPEAFEAWDDAASASVSLAFWSNATSARTPAAAAAAADHSASSLLAPGARAFLGLDFLPAGEAHVGSGDRVGGIAAVGLAFPGWGQFGGRSEGQQGADPWA